MINRRTFLKSAIAFPLSLNFLLDCSHKIETKYHNANNKQFPLLEVKGDYYNIGFQIGKFFRSNIRSIIKRRINWHSRLMKIIDSLEGKRLSYKLLELTQRYFPHIYQEINGIAKGSGINFNFFWAMSIKSELLALEDEPIGCSTIYYKNDKNNWLFHNEDGHVAYKDLMFLVKVTPPSGISFLSLAYPGLITGNGPSLNSMGIIQTTNYISSTKVEIGIPRYIIGRAILEAKTIKEAVEIATCEPRAYPYHHNLADMTKGTYYSSETIPDNYSIKEPKGIFFHTNHLILDRTADYELENTEYIAKSSLSRYNVIQSAINQLPPNQITPESFLNILSSHNQAPYSPCRHPENDIKISTLATSFYDLKSGIFRLYKGNLCNAIASNLYSDYSSNELN